MNFTSKSEFDRIKPRVSITNETPPYDLYKGVNRVLATSDLWKWFLGYSNIEYDLPTVSEQYFDPELMDHSLKMVNGEMAQNYGPVPYEVWDAETNSYKTETPQFHYQEENGVLLPEQSLLIHEFYRYLETIYPDHFDWATLLTNVEINDSIYNAAAIVDYKPNNLFFDLVASNLDKTMSIDETVKEALKIKIRNLRNNAYRRKLYSSITGYKLYAGDIFENIAVYPIGEYYPVKHKDKGVASQSILYVKESDILAEIERLENLVEETKEKIFDASKAEGLVFSYEIYFDTQKAEYDYYLNEKETYKDVADPTNNFYTVLRDKLGTIDLTDTENLLPLIQYYKDQLQLTTTSSDLYPYHVQFQDAIAYLTACYYVIFYRKTLETLVAYKLELDAMIALEDSEYNPSDVYNQELQLRMEIITIQKVIEALWNDRAQTSDTTQQAAIDAQIAVQKTKLSLAQGTYKIVKAKADFLQWSYAYVTGLRELLQSYYKQLTNQKDLYEKWKHYQLIKDKLRAEEAKTNKLEKWHKLYKTNFRLIDWKNETNIYQESSKEISTNTFLTTIPGQERHLYEIPNEPKSVSLLLNETLLSGKVYNDIIVYDSKNKPYFTNGRNQLLEYVSDSNEKTFSKRDIYVVEKPGNQVNYAVTTYKNKLKYKKIAFYPTQEEQITHVFNTNLAVYNSLNKVPINAEADSTGYLTQLAILNQSKRQLINAVPNPYALGSFLLEPHNALQYYPEEQKMEIILNDLKYPINADWGPDYFPETIPIKPKQLFLYGDESPILDSTQSFNFVTGFTKGKITFVNDYYSEHKPLVSNPLRFNVFGIGIQNEKGNILYLEGGLELIGTGFGVQRSLAEGVFYPQIIPATKPEKVVNFLYEDYGKLKSTIDSTEKALNLNFSFKFAEFINKYQPLVSLMNDYASRQAILGITEKIDPASIQYNITHQAIYNWLIASQKTLYINLLNSYITQLKNEQQRYKDQLVIVLAASKIDQNLATELTKIIDRYQSGFSIGEKGINEYEFEASTLLSYSVNECYDLFNTWTNTYHQFDNVLADLNQIKSIVAEYFVNSRDQFYETVAIDGETIESYTFGLSSTIIKVLRIIPMLGSDASGPIGKKEYYELDDLQNLVITKFDMGSVSGVCLTKQNRWSNGSPLFLNLENKQIAFSGNPYTTYYLEPAVRFIREYLSEQMYAEFNTEDYLEKLGDNIHILSTKLDTIRIMAHFDPLSDNQLLSFLDEESQQRYLTLTVGDFVMGAGIQEGTSITEILNNKIKISKPYSQKGSHLLTFQTKKMFVPKEIDESQVNLYQSQLLKKNLIDIKTPFDSTLWPRGKEWPNVSLANFSGLISPDWWKEYNYLGSFHRVMHIIHAENFDYSGKKNHLVVPSVINFSDGVFVELNTKKLFEKDKQDYLMRVEWLDHFTDNIKLIARATDNTNFGTQTLIQTDSSGFFSLISGAKYTDPNIKLKAQTFYWENETVPSYAVIGTSNAGHNGLFKNIDERSFPMIWGAPGNVYDGQIQNLQFKIKQHKRGILGQDADLDGPDAEFILKNKLRSIWNASEAQKEFQEQRIKLKEDEKLDSEKEKELLSCKDPLYEVPLGEYNIQLDYRQDGKSYTTIQTSFIKENFEDITKKSTVKLLSSKYLESKIMSSFSPLKYKRLDNSSGDLISYLRNNALTFKYLGEWTPTAKVINGKRQVVYPDELLEAAKLDYQRTKTIHYFVIDKVLYLDNVYDKYSENPYVTQDINYKKSILACSLQTHIVRDENGEPVLDIENNQIQKVEYCWTVKDFISCGIYGNLKNYSGTYVQYSNPPTRVGRQSLLIDTLAQKISGALGHYSLNGVYLNETSFDYKLKNLQEQIEFGVDYVQSTYVDPKNPVEWNTVKIDQKLKLNNKIFYCTVGLPYQTFNDTEIDSKCWNTFAQVQKNGDLIGFYQENGVLYFINMNKESLFMATLPFTPLSGMSKNEIETLYHPKTIKFDEALISPISRINSLVSGIKLPRKYINSSDFNFEVLLKPGHKHISWTYDDYLEQGTLAPLHVFDLTESEILKDPEHNLFYTNSYDEDGIPTKFVIKFEEQKYFKNLIYVVGNYQLINSQMEGFSEVNKTPLTTVIQGYEADYGTMSIQDRILRIEEINLRPVYSPALESKQNNSYVKFAGILYGITKNNTLRVGYERVPSEVDNILLRSNFITNLKPLLPVKPLDDGSNDVLGYDEETITFPMDDWLGTELPYPEITKVKITKPFIEKATKTITGTTPLEEFRYFKNLLLVEGLVSPQHPNLIQTNNTLEFSAAIQQIAIGDSVESAIALSGSVSNIKRFMLQTEGGANPQITIVTYNNGTLVAAGADGRLYYAKNITSLSEANPLIKVKTITNPLTQPSTSYYVSDIKFDAALNRWVIISRTDEGGGASFVATIENLDTGIIQYFYTNIISEPDANPNTVYTNYTDVESISPNAQMDTLKVVSLLAQDVASINLGATEVQTAIANGDYSLIRDGPYADASFSANATKFFKTNNLDAVYTVDNTIFAKTKTKTVDSTGAYTGELTSDSHWKRAELPILKNMLETQFSNSTNEELETYIIDYLTAYRQFYLGKPAEVRAVQPYKYIYDNFIKVGAAGAYKNLTEFSVLTTDFAFTGFKVVNQQISIPPAPLTTKDVIEFGSYTFRTYKISTNSAGVKNYVTPWRQYSLDYLTYILLATKDTPIVGNGIKNVIFTDNSLVLQTVNNDFSYIESSNLNCKNDIEDPSNWMTSNLPSYLSLAQSSSTTAAKVMIKVPAAQTSGDVFFEGENAKPEELFNGILAANASSTLSIFKFFRIKQVYHKNNIIIIAGSHISKTDFASYNAVTNSPDYYTDYMKYDNGETPMVLVSQDGGLSFEEVPLFNLSQFYSAASMSTPNDTSYLGATCDTIVPLTDGILIPFRYLATNTFAPKALKIPYSESLSLVTSVIDQVPNDIYGSTSGAHLIDTPMVLKTLTDDTFVGTITPSFVTTTEGDGIIGGTDNSFLFIGKNALNGLGDQAKIIMSATSASFTVGGDLIPFDEDSAEVVRVLVAIRTARSIRDLTPYISNAKLPEYIDDRKQFKVKTSIGVRTVDEADLMFSFRETLSVANKDPTDSRYVENGYPSLDEDEDHIFYEYIEEEVDRADGTTEIVYTPEEYKNKAGFPVILCDNLGNDVILDKTLVVPASRYLSPWQRLNSFVALSTCEKAGKPKYPSLVEAQTDSTIRRGDDTLNDIVNKRSRDRFIGSLNLNLVEPHAEVIASNIFLDAYKDYLFQVVKQKSDGTWYIDQTELEELYDYIQDIDGSFGSGRNATIPPQFNQFTLVGNAPSGTETIGTYIETTPNLAEGYPVGRDDNGDYIYEYPDIVTKTDVIINKFNITFSNYNDPYPRFSFDGPYVYDNLMECYPIKVKRYIETEAYVPYAHQQVSLTLSDSLFNVEPSDPDDEWAAYTEILKSIDNLTVTGLYIPMHGYGSTKDNNQLWTHALPWELDPSAFETSLLKNVMGDWVYLTDKNGVRIQSFRGTRLLRDGDEITIKKEEVVSGQTNMAINRDVYQPLFNVDIAEKVYIINPTTEIMLPSVIPTWNVEKNQNDYGLKLAGANCEVAYLECFQKGLKIKIDDIKNIRFYYNSFANPVWLPCDDYFIYTDRFVVYSASKNDKGQRPNFGMYGTNIRLEFDIGSEHFTYEWPATDNNDNQIWVKLCYPAFYLTDLAIFDINSVYQITLGNFGYGDMDWRGAEITHDPDIAVYSWAKPHFLGKGVWGTNMFGIDPITSLSDLTPSDDMILNILYNRNLNYVPLIYVNLRGEIKMKFRAPIINYDELHFYLNQDELGLRNIKTRDIKYYFNFGEGKKALSNLRLVNETGTEVDLLRKPASAGDYWYCPNGIERMQDVQIVTTPEQTLTFWYIKTNEYSFEQDGSVSYSFRFYENPTDGKCIDIKRREYTRWGTDYINYEDTEKAKDITVKHVVDENSTLKFDYINQIPDPENPGGYLNQIIPISITYAISSLGKFVFNGWQLSMFTEKNELQSQNKIWIKYSDKRGPDGQLLPAPAIIPIDQYWLIGDYNGATFKTRNFMKIVEFETGKYFEYGDDFVLDKDTPELNITVHVTGGQNIMYNVYGPVICQKPKYRNFRELLIEETDTIIPKPAKFIYWREELLEVVYEYSKQNPLPVFATSNTQFSLAKPVDKEKYNDGKKHIFKYKILPYKSKVLNPSVMNNKNFIWEVDYNESLFFGYDRLWFNPLGYLQPPVTLNNEIYRSESNYGFTSNLLWNKQGERVYEASKNGLYIYYIPGANKTIQSAEINPQDGDLSLYVNNVTDPRFQPPTPVYDSCQQWFESKFYVVNNPKNPFWQIIKINSAYDPQKQQFFQNSGIYKYVKVGNNMEVEKVPEEDVYTTIRQKIYSVLDNLLVFGESPYLSPTTGQIEFMLFQPAIKYKQISDIVELGIYVKNSFLNEKQTVWQSSTQVNSIFKTNYSVNNNQNLINKLDKNSSIVKVTELALLDQYRQMIFYSVFPPIEYRSDSQHISFNIIVSHEPLRPDQKNV